MSDQTIEQRLDEIKEATRRFCRTDEAADNLAKYILQLLDEAQINEWKMVDKNTIDKPFTPENQQDRTWQGGYRFAKNSFKRYKLQRIAQLTPKENKK